VIAPGAATAPTTPTLPFGERVRRVLPFFRSGRAGIVGAFVCLFIGALCELQIPILIKWLLDSGFQLGTVPLWTVPASIVGLTAVRGLAGFAAQYGMSWAANKGVLEMRTTMFERVLDAEPALFTTHTASNLINTLAYEIQNGANQLVSALQNLVRDSLTVLVLLGYLLYLNWQLTAIVAVLIPAIGWVTRHFSRRLHRYTVQAQTATDDLAYVVEENVHAWKSVRLHAAGAGQAGRFRAVSDRLRRVSLKAVVAAATMTPLTQILASVALAAVVTTAIWQSGRDAATVGGFVAFLTALMQLIAPMKHLAEIATPITRGLAALDRAIGLVDRTSPERGGRHDPGRARGHVLFENVSLSYPGGGTGRAALHGLTLELRPGESVALVGPSGSGKTTIVNLLPRFLEPTAGRVLLDGVPLADWDVAALRRQFALVSQDVSMLNASVAENVAFGAATIDRARVERAIAAANLSEFVAGLPDGIDTGVGHNASMLSGGQRQRLAIARAVYKDAPILILDEATSALDAESERLVQQALEALMEGRTSLVVAHRLSTIERAGRIVSLEAGRIVEQASHQELLAAGGLYARMHALQRGH
jgi:subfamily B ATP-binding cassette protein MsbA